MAGYGELLQTMAAIVIFGLILMSANRMIQRNTMMQVEGELEQEVVALAQDIIEESRTLEFDENSQGEVPPTKIPDDFTNPGNLGSDKDASNPEVNDDLDGDGTVQRNEFDDFDDYHEWKDTLETAHGRFFLETEVFYVDETNYEKSGGRTTFKKIRVNIVNEFLQKSNAENPTTYYLEFIRNYYAD
ncbi:type IV pilus modification PilV family protein [Fodinibius sp. SL11]|uniref:type IV pilus modification PilV family protein n=1 Tax=Fodinibius sp. SL11 TaxID=3425690 RepID=UPI003F884F09